ncbi:MAG: hypothetical protein K2W80_18955 [Burkholderiales bacterium]|nr:hypothetical protein [Burkholderiales bacterium]
MSARAKAGAGVREAVAGLQRLRTTVASLPARLSWAFAGAVHRIGWGGVAGCVLILLGTAALLYSSLHLEAVVERDRERLSRTIAEKRTRIQPISEAMQSPVARLEQFYGEFPLVGDIPGSLGIVVRLAAAHDLALDQGQYRLGAEAAGPLLRYEMKLPVRGSYRQIRAFVEELLVEVPSFALDGVEFKREAVGDASLDAAIEFSLYVRAR